MNILPLVTVVKEDSQQAIEIQICSTEINLGV
jgi:hypothetical protein